MGRWAGGCRKLAAHPDVPCQCSHSPPYTPPKARLGQYTASPAPTFRLSRDISPRGTTSSTGCTAVSTARSCGREGTLVTIESTSCAGCAAQLRPEGRWGSRRGPRQPASLLACLTATANMPPACLPISCGRLPTHLRAHLIVQPLPHQHLTGGRVDGAGAHPHRRRCAAVLAGRHERGCRGAGGWGGCVGLDVLPQSCV